VTNAAFLQGKDALAVSVPDSDTELVARIVAEESSFDFALLKVSGLTLPSAEFAINNPETGDVIWTVSMNNDQNLDVISGILRSAYRLAANDVGILSHDAASGDNGQAPSGSVVLNDCGHLVGLNMSFRNPDANVRAIDTASLLAMLAKQNLRPDLAATACLSPLVVARQQAESASKNAQRANREAEQARKVAQRLESELRRSSEQETGAIEQARQARQRADLAIEAAEAAVMKAEQTRQNFEQQTREIVASVVATTEARIKKVEQGRELSEQRFADAMARQRQESQSRDRMLLTAGIIIIIVLLVILVTFGFMLRRQGSPSFGDKSSLDKSSGGKSAMERSSVEKSSIQAIAKPPTADAGSSFEYVLDGEDETGIRYLLRISGDKLNGNAGAVIGRNPMDSPFVINHSDVSRKHARMKVMKRRLFIEDLGSTNGTIVNGQSIDDMGPVSVDDGDQIIIGSVKMRLRVLAQNQRSVS
jgi:hypothetical protein